MRLKKFLSAALSAAMLISCVSFGGGTVVQAAGEMNIARNLQISAYSGTEGDFPVSSVNDGRGDDTQNDNYRWFSKEALKGSGARGNAAYLIFDLGENGPRSFSGIDIRFHNMAYIFRQIVTEATGVKDDATATEHEVSEAVIALIDGMIALEKEKVYTVTVDGKKVAEGVYNQIVTITADASQVGQKFAGWQLKDKIVSYDEVYTFAISGNMAFTATYAPQEQTIEKPLYAAVADTMIIKRADGKANVKYIAKLSIPDNYILNETGLLWYGKPDLENLCTETGPTPGTKKIVAPVISSTYQFAVNVNGIPAGKTIRGVIYAKVTDKETQQTKWVYSEEVRLTNK